MASNMNGDDFSLVKSKAPTGWTVQETVGVSIVNPRAVSRMIINSDNSVVLDPVPIPWTDGFVILVVRTRRGGSSHVSVHVRHAESAAATAGRDVAELRARPGLVQPGAGVVLTAVSPTDARWMKDTHVGDISYSESGPTFVPPGDDHASIYCGSEALDRLMLLFVAAGGVRADSCPPDVDTVKNFLSDIMETTARLTVAAEVSLP